MIDVIYSAQFKQSKNNIAIIIAIAFTIKVNENAQIYHAVGVVVTTSLSTREVWGLIPEPIKLDKVATARAVRRFFGAVLSRR